jgi:hypothetical protein
MFGETENAYVGKMLKKLNTGKSYKNLLLEMGWEERARFLQAIKNIRKCQNEFHKIMADES